MKELVAPGARPVVHESAESRILRLNLLCTSASLPIPIDRPAIPLAIRQQDKEQKHVDELTSGDIPILRQASSNL